MRYVRISKGWPKVYDVRGMEVAVVNRLFCGWVGCGGTVGWMMVWSLLIYFPATGRIVFNGSPEKKGPLPQQRRGRGT